jgi:hypothetical protein
VEVRSLKVSYRDEYQRMLEYISAQSSQLLFDARASAQMPVTPKWTREPPLLQHPGSDADRKGQDERANEFRGFHEILPGLGAFAISPGPDGSPKGMEHLNRFLADVLEHLSTRTTSRERVSYHLREAYGGKALGEATVEYRIKQSIPERDTATGERLVPPSEHPVLVGWYENADDRHLAWILSSGFYNFRAGDRNGSIRLEPRIAGAKHLLLHTQGGTAHPKLVTAMLRKRGWRVVRIWEHALARKHEARLVASLRRFLRA